MLRTPICDLFGIDYPILLAGMGGVSMAPLVAAVSHAGGLGVMGAAALSPDHLRAEIRKTKALTRKPFAVDLLAPLPQMIVPYLPILYEEEVEIFVAGHGEPGDEDLDLLLVEDGQVGHDHLRQRRQQVDGERFAGERLGLADLRAQVVGRERGRAHHPEAAGV